MRDELGEPHTGQARTVGVIGAGYVGATTAAAMIRLGCRVVVIDNDADKVRRLQQGHCPLAEPGLDDAFAAGRSEDRLLFGTELSRLAPATVVFVCVPTPGRPDGSADTSVADSVIDDVVVHLAADSVIVVKSTVPVGTADTIRKRLAHRQIEVVSNPEFLREGRALHDFLEPDRIVVGGASPDAVNEVAALYDGLDAPLIRTDSRSAELAKYACNGYLALKLSYVNELSDLAHAVGADIGVTTEIMGLDPRIGPAHLTPGPGWGGSCLPKDSQALLASASETGIGLTTISAAVDANDDRGRRIAQRLAELARRRNPERPTVAILGLTFKAGTADLAASPALRIAGHLMDARVAVVGHDPTISPPSRVGEVVDVEVVDVEGVDVLPTAAAALDRADAAAILTDWPEYRELRARCDIVPTA
ncbi:nucleotide sugar dehydrogenase [Gordonia sp. DT219]|uniref:nucleotide sugar dehydrogenase n=1 Tax=Gordonia sp. DT219 TaxID=3416658 RepID=UPI003CEB35EA